MSDWFPVEMSRCKDGVLRPRKRKLQLTDDEKAERAEKKKRYAKIYKPNVPFSVREALRFERAESKYLKRTAEGISAQLHAVVAEEDEVKNIYIDCTGGVTVLRIGCIRLGYRDFEVPTVYKKFLEAETWYILAKTGEVLCSLKSISAIKDAIFASGHYSRDPEFMSTISLKRVIAILAWGHIGKITKTSLKHSLSYIPLESLTCNVHYMDNRGVDRFYTPTDWKDAYVEPV